MAGIATRNSARLILGVQRSGVPVHSAAVHVPVHEDAMQMDQEGLDGNGDGYEDGYENEDENGDRNGENR